VKGVFFVVDAALAAMIALTLLAMAYWVVSEKTAVDERTEALYDAATDLMTVMDKTELLKPVANVTDAEANASIMAFINATLPKNMEARYLVSLYRKSYGGCPPGCNFGTRGTFCLCRQFGSATANDSNATQVGTFRRAFYTEDETTWYWGLIEVWTWFK